MTNIKWKASKQRYGTAHFATFWYQGKETHVMLDPWSRQVIFINRLINGEWKRTGVYEGSLKQAKEHIEYCRDHNEMEVES